MISVAACSITENDRGKTKRHATIQPIIHKQQQSISAPTLPVKEDCKPERSPRRRLSSQDLGKHVRRLFSAAYRDSTDQGHEDPRILIVHYIFRVDCLHQIILINLLSYAYNSPNQNRLDFVRKHKTSKQYDVSVTSIRVCPFGDVEVDTATFVRFFVVLIGNHDDRLSLGVSRKGSVTKRSLSVGEVKSGPTSLRWRQNNNVDHGGVQGLTQKGPEAPIEASPDWESRR